MQIWQVLIIIVVLAVIIGNIMLLKHSAKIGFKIPDKKADTKQQKKP
ncbi:MULTISPECIES: DUF2897 family protein [Pseudoalteromonas]|uniref:DUF2897 family protein n=1 Tax=Pseudoalteromonas haloplanktis TaxID=228 RepID=A0ABU1BAF5_PSEHA|nr:MULTISPECIES: DUF2897 family protein [Pseudoalteromonas]MCF6143334.1 hypothetical protein [Pseudoalteromonas mariniglutinosa NCIMB 1770]MDQ9091504.1 DUF2897 family protein [Pseudoalteromonas haloplanktis]TMN71863.1 DUF2897 domain-containing protein [Pseudoalteromonas sp. S1727]